ncbi:cation:proton antiporter [Streptacidiphilus sp. N1-10]|uniref:Cation:proton antiporter n=1 Tax=Streptacidiphilus jeojiensis TaxID=3229225 RepID=A0ABV6XRR3_9ACTN
MTGLDSTTRLLLALAVLLGLSRLSGLAAARLGQPPVVGEILAGVALGPSLLGHALPALHHALFGPDVMPSVNGLSQVGLALYAFEIGNELTAPSRGRPATARPLLWITTASLLAPALAALALGPYLYGDHLGGPHGGSAALTVFLACALGVTAVPVLARLLQDRGMAGTTVGRLSLAAASVGDGVCWCLLALALHLTGLIGTGRTVAGVAGAVVAVLVIHRRHSRPAGRTEGRRWGLAPMLALLCLAAGTSSALGLHPLLGGLLLGAAWPSTGRSAEILRRIRPMAAALLPCFFLGMGQQIDVTSAFGGAGFVPLVLLLLAAAVVTKLAAVTGAGLAFHSSLRDATRLGVLMNAKGLTEIVVLSIGYQDGLIGRTLFEALIVVALVTTVLTGPALALLDRPATDGPRPRPARDPAPVGSERTGGATF